MSSDNGEEIASASRGAAQTGHRFCRNCGAALRAADAFCRRCGKRRPRSTERVEPLPAATPGAFADADILPALRRIRDGVNARLSHAQAALRLTPYDDSLTLPLPIEIAVVFALTLLAFFLRANNLSDIPPGIHGDEANYALEVERILRDGWIGVWTGVNLGAPTGHLYLAAPFFIFGGQSIEALRLASALVGTAVLPAAYILVRQLFGVRIGLTAAAMLAVSAWFVTQSRIAWDPIYCVFFQTLTFSLLITGMRQKRAWIVIAAGLAFGLSLYFYKASLIYFMFGSAAIVGLLFISCELRRRRIIYWFICLSIVVAAPMLLHYLTAVNITETVSGSYGTDTSLSSASQVERMKRAWDVLMLVHSPIDVGSEGVGGTPIFTLPLARLLFWVSMAASLLFINKRPYQLLLIGWLIAMIPAILVPGMESRRYLLGILYLFVFVSIGLSVLIRIFLNWLPVRSVWFTRISSAAIPTVFVVLFAINTMSDFDEWTHDRADFYFIHNEVQAARYVQSLGDGYEVRFYSPRHSFNYPTFRYLLPHTPFHDGSSEFGGDGTATSGGELKGDTIFLLLGKYLDKGLQTEIETAYSGGRWHAGYDSAGETIYAAYIVEVPQP